MLTQVAALDDLLDAHARALGRDALGYRHHCYRVLNLCVALARADGDAIERVAIAAACHDLGIWTAGTFDYLQPSAELAAAHLRATGREHWLAEVTDMILTHHKVRPTSRDASALVEAFRRADWIDVSLGLVRFGIPRATVRALYLRWPDAGFHARLLQFAWRRLRTHPLSPLPMLRF